MNYPFKYAEIAKKFRDSKNRYKDYTTRQETIYMNGMIDVLDAISDTHPELLTRMFSIREAIENLIEANDDNS